MRASQTSLPACDPTGTAIRTSNLRRMHMADQKAPQMQATLGITGLTSNAMALIAPGAFLWLTFYIQATTGTTAPTMWLGIFAALLLCLATAVAYAEISKLYPGTGSSYYYAEQALLSEEKAFKYARVAKFIVDRKSTRLNSSH